VSCGGSLVGVLAKRSVRAPRVWPQIYFHQIRVFKKTIKKIGGKKKKERGKHVISRNFESTRFSENPCKKEFQQNKNEATAMA